MQENFYLIIGIVILLLVIYDFFYTTLSGSGAAFITEYVSIFSDKSVKLLVKVFGRSAFKINGLFVNLMTLTIWILLVWVGLFLVFSYNPEAITNSSGKIADFYERLYYTGYVISTLGMGNFIPTSRFFEIVTSCFAFFGFIFFTTAMTYFLSVSSALINKRVLSKSIYNLGKTPQEIADFLLSLDSSYSYQQFLKLQGLVDTHSVNHHAYPVIHFFTESKPKNCFSLNLARLDEALSILIDSPEAGNLQKELIPVRSSITSFLQKLDESFSNSLPNVKSALEPSKFPYDNKISKGEDFSFRRRIMERLFKSEGFNWNDVI